MASKYGATHNLPGYDRFRTGLTYNDVRKMLWAVQQAKGKRPAEEKIAAIVNRGG